MMLHWTAPLLRHRRRAATQQPLECQDCEACAVEGPYTQPWADARSRWLSMPASHYRARLAAEHVRGARSGRVAGFTWGVLCGCLLVAGALQLGWWAGA